MADDTTQPPKVTPTPEDGGPAGTYEQGGSMGASEDIAELLSYDPFAETEESLEETPEPSVTDEGQADGGAPAVAEAPGDGGQQSQPPMNANQPGTNALPGGAVGPEAELQQLRTQVAQMSGMLQQMQQVSQANQGQRAGQQESQEDALARMYNLTIPDQLFAAMNSEDPNERRQAIAHAFNGLARVVHSNVRQEYSTALQQQVPQMLQQRQQHEQFQRQVFNDFYGANPDLNRPELRQAIVGVASQLMREGQATGQFQTWDANFSQALATRVRGVLSSWQQTQTPPAPAAPKPPVMAPNGVRPADAVPNQQRNDPNSQAAIEQTLFG